MTYWVRGTGPFRRVSYVMPTGDGNGYATHMRVGHTPEHQTRWERSCVHRDGSNLRDVDVESYGAQGRDEYRRVDWVHSGTPSAP